MRLGQPFRRLAGGLSARFQGALNERVPQGMDNLAGELGIVRVEADIHQLRFGSGRDGESIDKVVDQPFRIDASASRFFWLRCQREQPTKPLASKESPFPRCPLLNSGFSASFSLSITFSARSLDLRISNWVLKYSLLEVSDS